MFPEFLSQELADKFGISQRTVYRDIRALEEAGVPIIGEAGTGYCLAAIPLAKTFPNVA